MQKKIIVLAIAAALTAPALALAEASVYGQANLSIDMAKDGAATNETSANQLVSNVSRVGVKGSEDLGGGLSAIWQMEATVGMDTGSAGAAYTVPAAAPAAGTKLDTVLFDRNTYLGLKSSDAGTLILGRYDTPYKISTRKLDVFIDTVVADNRGLNGIGMMGTLGGISALSQDARTTNSIGYASPSMSGFTVQIASVFGAEKLGTPTTANKKGSAMSMAGMYEQGPIYATLAYQTVKFGDAGTGDLAAPGAIPSGPTVVVDDKVLATKLGGSYAMDQFAVNLVFESLKYTAAAGGDKKATNIYLAGKFNVSSTDAVKLAYTKRGATKATATNKDGATQISVGYDHGMSKNTTVYALYTKVTQEEDPAPATANPDPSTLSFGIKHAF